MLQKCILNSIWDIHPNTQDRIQFWKVFNVTKCILNSFFFTKCILVLLDIYYWMRIHFVSSSVSSNGRLRYNWKIYKSQNLGLLCFCYRMIPHSAFHIPHSTFHIPHSAFRIPDSISESWILCQTSAYLYVCIPLWMNEWMTIM